MNIDVLKAELTDDPLALGYSGMTDAEAAASLNMVNRTVNVESVSGQNIFEAATLSDYNALDAGQRQVFLAICGMGTILVNGTNTKAALLAMFGVGTDTRANLAALQTTQISRATELGLGRVRNGDVQKARS